MEKLEFVDTADGSKTLFHREVGEHYHSKHGAKQESLHVFLKSGLQFYLDKENTTKASILEIGFGTGLNFLLTADFANHENLTIDYVGIEAYPLSHQLIQESGYDQFVDPVIWNQFCKIYPEALLKSCSFHKEINLTIPHQQLLQFQSDKKFDLIYFDAFAEIHQPEMWTIESLSHIRQFLNPGAVFVTYAITGNLKRAMKSLGFSIEKAPGAPGKREMLRAVLLEDELLA
ncbi:tRNA (5-methylaminomethyl-2-thiouridine)(34)-methyltransferase MnmD [Sphingobacterium sp. HJSM2_6]|uniref:tRNA (5-methylaminomethyl-2-thiouridine)(34)-methyltransferase MnmD n=1 Tax=Sphingobacterium sp. HJSM2_6 TaxID=3366264 RepID=UPI003BDE71E3